MLENAERSFNRLPAVMTRFIGRDWEIAAVLRLMGCDSTGIDVPAGAGSGARMVTLCGLGGSGKTRLALELCNRLLDPSHRCHPKYSDGVSWVELASLSDPAPLAQFVAAACDLPGTVGKGSVEALTTRFGAQHALLVLDNCEHLAAACTELAEALLAECPHLVVLATSRTTLQLNGEQVFWVPPMHTAAVRGPVADRHLVHSEATRLLVDRAALVAAVDGFTDSDIQVIDRICQKLEGIPLAIELAASWVRVLSLEDLESELDRSISFLSSTTPNVAGRHRSMRAVLDTSWSWLGAGNQRVLSCLSIFVGGFTREAAESVAGATLSSLSLLVEKSLIQRSPTGRGDTRYDMHELLRRYSLDRLAGPGSEVEEETVRRRHLDYYLGLVEERQTLYNTAAEVPWFHRLRAEQANLNAALRWALDRDLAEEALRFSTALLVLRVPHMSGTEYGAVMEHALDLPWDDTSPTVTRPRARAATIAGYAALTASNLEQALKRLDEGLRLYRELNDVPNIAFVLRGLSACHRRTGDLDEAQRVAERSLDLCRDCGDSPGEAASLDDLGLLALARGDLEQAESMFQEALALLAAHDVVFGVYRSHVMLGEVYRRKADWPPALEHYTRALVLLRQLYFDRRDADILEGLAEIAAVLGQPDSSARLFGAAQSWRHAFGRRPLGYLGRGISEGQSQLGSDAWWARHEEGRRLAPEEALDAARACADALAAVLADRRLRHLTEREVEVLRLLALGLSNQGIARQLRISPRTVHSHVRSIFNRLDVASRTAAVHEAVKLRLVAEGSH